MKKLLEMLEEPNGGVSSNRAVFVLWFVVMTAAFGYLTVLNGAFPDIPASAVAMAMALLGGKVVQRGVEAKNEQ